MSHFNIVPMFHPFARADLFDIPAQSRLYDQHFGTGLAEEDFFPSSSLLHNYYIRPRRLIQRQTSGLSEIRNDPTKFQVMLDVNQFTPDEITVKTIDNCVVIHGKHEEKLDEHGYVSREFQRRYVLPETVEATSVTSSLSHDGILTVEAPRQALEAPKPNERTVPIERKPQPLPQADAKSEAAAAAK